MYSTIAALVVLAAGTTAVAEVGLPPAPSSGQFRVTKPNVVKRQKPDVAADAMTAMPETSPNDIPLAKRKPAAEKDAKAAATKSIEQAPSPANDSIRPIDDSQPSGPVSLEAASFKGVVPGTSTKAEVIKAWGQPKKTSQADGSVIQLYSIAPFDRVEVTYDGGKVASIVIRLDRAFPAAAVAKQLDLAAIRPVQISSETGEVLGFAYPERGVLLAFEPGDKPTKPSMKVSQIILEPLSAEPFVLRAETTLESQQDLSSRDLKQALSLEPSNAHAQWLFSRVLTATEQHESALKAAGQAVRFEPNNAQYRVTHAQALAQTGQLTEALEETRKATSLSEKSPHIKARAMCLTGDLLASGSAPDFKKALGFHTQAIQLSDTLSSDPQTAIRVAAKEVLIDAHLGAAHDIAWGEWKDKPKAVARWLDRAVTAADDMVNSEGGSQEQPFRVYSRSLGAYVGVRGEIDPAPAAKAVVESGEKLIAETTDPSRKARFHWELGTALYDAVQICQMRSEQDTALKYGEIAAGHMAEAIEAKTPLASTFLLGRLYFRLGTIHAMRDRDHKTAVTWFNKAIPLMEQASPDDLGGDLGRQGEAFVGMGVSYWETDQREKAVALTQKGIKWMEQAAKQGSLERSSLAIPYSNLAAMHRKLGDDDLAKRFQEMAGRAKSGKVK